MQEQKQLERRIHVHRQLTEMQEKFLNALFGEAGGNYAKAMRIAGYAPSTKSHALIQSLRSEIIERAELQLAVNAPKAVMSMVGILDDPTALGNREKLVAAQQLLDRVGLSRVEKINVSSDKPMGLFILPEKKNDDIKQIESNEPVL